MDEARGWYADGRHMARSGVHTFGLTATMAHSADHRPGFWASMREADRDAWIKGWNDGITEKSQALTAAMAAEAKLETALTQAEQVVNSLFVDVLIDGGDEVEAAEQAAIAERDRLFREWLKAKQAVRLLTEGQWW